MNTTDGLADRTTTTGQALTGAMDRQAQDPAAGSPVSVRAARASVPGGPAAAGSPPLAAGGKTPRPEGSPTPLQGAARTSSRKFKVSDLPEKLASKIFVNPDTGCWEWTVSISPKGYGTHYWEGRNWRTHRLIYTLLVGPIPDGLDLDHVKAWGCASKACCWPGHLEPVTTVENNRRAGGNARILPFADANRAKTHCPQGHPYDEENTIRKSDGHRECKACKRLSSQRYRARNKDKIRNKRRSPKRVRIMLPADVAEDAARMSAEDGADLSCWVAECIRAEITRRAGQIEPGAA